MIMSPIFSFGSHLKVIVEKMEITIELGRMAEGKCDQVAHPLFYRREIIL